MTRTGREHLAINHARLLALTMLLVIAAPALAQVLDAPRPIEALDSVWIEELTWMEVRDAIEGGKTTVLIATGGIEQNGPYVATGKHNYVLQAMAEAIARRLGNALVAPIIAFVPEGDIEPPTGHMEFPGTISLRAETYKLLLTDICNSLKQHGFRDIIMIGDSGGNQDGMREVAEALSKEWAGSTTSIYFIKEYYDSWQDAEEAVEQITGITEVPENIHDDYSVTSIIMTVDPEKVRYEERVRAGKASINGISISPAQNTIAHGKELVEIRVNATVEAIRRVISGSGSDQ